MAMDFLLRILVKHPIASLILRLWRTNKESSPISWWQTSVMFLTRVYYGLQLSGWQTAVVNGRLGDRQSVGDVLRLYTRQGARLHHWVRVLRANLHCNIEHRGINTHSQKTPDVGIRTIRIIQLIVGIIKRSLTNDNTRINWSLMYGVSGTLSHWVTKALVNKLVLAQDIHIW